ncbi:helix-turn-helix transcriptional regulator [Actinacidiphila alni]|uniref:helix-turn-helix transcriptional regulator n=1 Tax=Actinacidiphila alni TaxID=380248 RepID=UPI0034551B86
MQKTSARLLALLSLLQARRDWPGAELAARLGVSDRTVRRDVDRLRELGYPIAAVKGPDGGYRLGAGARLPPLLFDDDQAVALAIALRMAAATGAGIEEAAARALATVRQVLPARLRHRVDTLAVTALPRPGARADSEVLTALSAAVHATEVLRFDYVRTGEAAPEAAGATAPRRDYARTGEAAPEAADGTVPRRARTPEVRDDTTPRRVEAHGWVDEAHARTDEAAPGTGEAAPTAGEAKAPRPADAQLCTDEAAPGTGGAALTAREATAPRRVEPYHLVARGGRWYLLAWDLDRADWRTFRADRIRDPRTPTGPRFTPRPVPGGDAAAFVAARFRGAANTGDTTDWPCRGEVVLHLPAATVTAYAPDDTTVEPVGPDRCRVTAASWSWPALAASFARYDAPLDVVGPPALADAFAALARRFTEATTGRAGRENPGSGPAPPP